METKIELELTKEQLVKTQEELDDVNKAYMELLAKFNKFESGSNKSALNIHEKGKNNLQKYIDVFYPQNPTTGDFLRECVEIRTGKDYYEIIRGEF